MLRRYIIQRTDEDVTCLVVEAGGYEYDLWERHISTIGAYHSPTGFEFGYGGSGPTELARAILCDLNEREVDCSDYYDFRVKAIQPLKCNAIIAFDNFDTWTMTDFDGYVLATCRHGVYSRPTEPVRVGPIYRD